MATISPHDPHDLLATLLAPVLERAHLELVDIVVSSLGTSQAAVQVLVDHTPNHPLAGRIDLDGVSAATRLIDEVLETADPIPGAFTLEVSSPGLERPLRTPAHFVRFVGTTVSVKTIAGSTGDRRVEGRLQEADPTVEGGVVVDGTRIPYSAIERARTVFVWGPTPKPGSGPSKSAAKRAGKMVVPSEVSETSSDGPLQHVPGITSHRDGGSGEVPHKQIPASAGIDHEEE